MWDKIDMKTLLISIMILLASIASAADLRWNAADGATGYNVYFNSDGTETYPYNYNAGNTTEVLDIQNTLNLQPGTTYTFVVTAYNDVGESDFSNSAAWDTPSSYVNPDNNLPITLTRPATITITIE